jgi:hypothetical protein
MKINNRIQIWALSLLAVSILFVAGFFGAKTLIAVSQGPMPQSSPSQSKDSSQESPFLTPEEEFPYQFPKNSTFFSVLRSEGVSGSEIQKIVEAARPHYNLSKIQPWIRYQLRYD